MRRWIGCLVLLGLAACVQKQLPVLGEIPHFELITHEGNSFSTKEMRGKVWVANFIFTSCAGACPLLTARMKGVQTAMNSGGGDPSAFPAQIVSFSVDPEQDTPTVLKEYAARHGVDFRNWVFVTGPLEQVSQAVVNGFKVSMGKMPAQGQVAGAGEIFEVVHGEQFLLIDHRGYIRGYYSSEGEGVRILLADLRRLLKEKGNSQ